MDGDEGTYDGNNDQNKIRMCVGNDDVMLL